MRKRTYKHGYTTATFVLPKEVSLKLKQKSLDVSVKEEAFVSMSEVVERVLRKYLKIDIEK